MGLNHTSTIHFNNWKTYKVFLAALANAAAVGLRAQFGINKTKFNTDYATAVLISNRANATPAGLTAQQIEHKHTACNTVGGITSNIHSYAIDRGLTALKGQMEKLTPAYLFANKNEDCVSSCNTILTDAAALLISDPTASNYFETADLTAAGLTVITFHDDLGVYYSEVADINNAKTEFEFTHIPIMTADLDSLQGLLPGVITTTYPAFAETFIAMREINHTGKKDQGVILDLLKDHETNLPIVMDGNMTINQPPYPATKKPKSKNTNSMGAIPIMNLKIGTWTITFTAPGYHPITITVVITSKHVNHLTISLIHV